jgi:hypothetical protein
MPRALVSDSPSSICIPSSIARFKDRAGADVAVAAYFFLLVGVSDGGSHARFEQEHACPDGNRKKGLIFCG